MRLEFCFAHHIVFAFCDNEAHLQSTYELIRFLYNFFESSSCSVGYVELARSLIDVQVLQQ